MKLLGDAAAHAEVINAQRSNIERLETYLGSLNIRAQMIEDKPAPWLGWIVYPDDVSLVMVFETYNWGPGSGPVPSLAIALGSLLSALDSCEGIAAGKPGRHEYVGKPSLIRSVLPIIAPPAKLHELTTAERQLAMMTADLELIGKAFMKGQPPGSCFTPAQIADWVRERRAEEIIRNCPECRAYWCFPTPGPRCEKHNPSPK